MSLKDQQTLANTFSAALTAAASTVGTPARGAIDTAAAQGMPALTAAQGTYSALDRAMPVLDLNYAQTMALYGIETFTRSTTDTYTDMAGNSQSAAVNAPAFDRQNRIGVGWFVPFGLKAAGSGVATFNPSKILPTGGYTIVVDVDRPSSYTGSGTILALNDGTAANRVEISLNSSYQASFVVQSAGTVVVNASLGNTQNWYGGPRRLVIAVKGGAFAYADDGQYYGSVTSGSAPSSTALTTLSVGGSAASGSYFTGWVKRVQILPVALTQQQVVNLSGGSTPVACWGDSLTAGTGASGVANFYPEQLRIARYPHSGTYNGGIGGQTSTQIRARMLADTIRKDWTTILWAGRNNFADPATVVADLQAMAANLSHGRFLVMSVINRADGTESAGSTAYAQIMALNARIQAAFPNNYLDIRSSVVQASGGTGDAPNNSWTYDGLHFNNTGYQYVASTVGSWLRGRGWY